MSNWLLVTTYCFIVSCLIRFCGGQTYKCEKLDFDKSSVVGLIECKDRFLPKLVSKEYASSPYDPYRPDSKYFLSTNREGLVCGETAKTFTLDEHTTIKMPLLLDFTNRGSYINIILQNITDPNKPVDVETWEMNTFTKQWEIFERTFTLRIEKAKVILMVNTNVQSSLLIEYLHILNSEIADENECIADEPFTTTPTTTTTTEDTTTSTSTTTEDTTTTTTTTEDTTTSTSTTEDTPSTTTTSITILDTTKSPDNLDTTEIPKPVTDSTTTASSSSGDQNGNDRSSEEMFWMILCFVFIGLFVITSMLAMYFYGIQKKRYSIEEKKRGHLQQVLTAPAITPPGGVLPRLMIEVQPNKKPMIVGVDSLNGSI